MNQSFCLQDSSYADGYSPPERVAQRYVIAIKEGKGRATWHGSSTCSERPPSSRSEATSSDSML